MIITRIHPMKPDPKTLREAAAVLRRGGLVVYPTETAYALGCDFSDPRAVKRIFAVKKRGARKQLPVIAASAAMVRRFASMNAANKALAASFWPGSLTLVLDPKTQKVPAGTFWNAWKNGLAVRVSPHPVARELSRLLGKPVISTSANRSGGPTPYAIADVLAQIGMLPDMILDVGTLKHVAPSTIVRCASGDVCEILRPGPITENKIARSLRLCL